MVLPACRRSNKLHAWANQILFLGPYWTAGIVTSIVSTYLWLKVCDAASLLINAQCVYFHPRYVFVSLCGASTHEFNRLDDNLGRILRKLRKAKVSRA